MPNIGFEPMIFHFAQVTALTTKLKGHLNFIFIYLIL